VHLADLVAGRRDELLAQFEARARKQADARGLRRVELLDSMPQFLDDLVEELAAEAPGAATEASAVDHAVDRLQVGFDADSVVREYFLIAQVILQVASAAGVVPTFAELGVLLGAVGEGAATAAAEYMRRREADLVRREAAHAGFLAHEMRNWLSSARFAYDLLRERELRDASSELLGVLDNSLRRAGQQLDDALLGQRLRGGVVAPTTIELRRLCEELVAEARGQMNEKDVRVDLDVPAELTLLADARLLRSALSNLVRNAVKFTKAGTRVQLRAEATAGELRLEVEDRCGGIADSAVERLFAPFTQEAPDRSGFGLGLPIARAAAEVQGGALTVRNLPDRGCVFQLTLPLHVQERP
jgi:signal transduction histidine kinase